MKKLFWGGVAGIAAFEVLHVWFLMPLPGAQQVDSLAAAYFLHSWRWAIRGALLLAIVAGARAAFSIRHKWLPVLGLLLVASLAWFVNFKMAADVMFEMPHQLDFRPRSGNAIDESAVVLGVEINGESKAYPIRFLVYHHQVQDTVGGKPILVTYCSVCRTGRVFEPVVDGKPETFRLVGMDHWNALFEDARTHSWWRQATGEAAVGPLRGRSLPEVESKQATLSEWFDLHPASKVMQVDEASKAHYDPTGRYERGESASALTGTSRAPWQEKSWVVGITVDGSSKAYDWIQLRKVRVINDMIGKTPIVLALATDQASFVAFERPLAKEIFSIEGDHLQSGGRSYDFSGRDRTGFSNAPAPRLKPVPAHQEFWHSWRTFHPGTAQFPD